MKLKSTLYYAYLGGEDEEEKEKRNIELLNSQSNDNKQTILGSPTQKPVCFASQGREREIKRRVEFQGG